MKKTKIPGKRVVNKIALKPIEIRIIGYEVVEKRANKGGSSGRIYVPRSWVGKLVRAVRIEK